MLTTFKATAEKYQGHLSIKTKARDFELIFDEPTELGGSNIALNPVEGILCALGACQSIIVAAFAESQNFKYDDFRVELEGDLDTDGFMGLSNVRPGFQEIRFNFIFKTNESMEKVEEFSNFIEKTCPVGDCLINGVKLVRNKIIINNN